MNPDIKKVKYELRLRLIEQLVKKPAKNFKQAKELTGLSQSTILKVCDYFGIDPGTIVQRDESLFNPNSIARLREIIGHLEHCESFYDIAARMKLTRQRIDQIAQELGISEDLKRYFYLKKRVRSLSKIVAHQNLKAILLESDSFKMVAEKVDVLEGHLRKILEDVLAEERFKQLVIYYNQKLAMAKVSRLFKKETGGGLSD